jgi:hypothetical protein
MSAQATGGNAVVALVRRSGRENIKARDSPENLLQPVFPVPLPVLLDFYME